MSQIRRSEMRIEAMALRDAADWASEHGVDAEDPFATGPAGGVGKYVASDGTPWIDEHVAKEYGALRGTSTFEATDLIIDALDLRHRFRRIWRAIKNLQIRVRDARRISRQCRDLSMEAAAAVDAELFRTASLGLPWPRLARILSAAIINADPALHQSKLQAAKFDRRVWLSESEYGLRTMVIKADEGDQILLYALVERIAEILELEGDSDPIDQRRSKAASWLARPEDLVVLLYKHSAGATPDNHDHQPDRGQAAADQPAERGDVPPPAGPSEAADDAQPEPADHQTDPEPGLQPASQPADGGNHHPSGDQLPTDESGLRPEPRTTGDRDNHPTADDQPAAADQPDEPRHHAPSDAQETPNAERTTTTSGAADEAAGPDVSDQFDGAADPAAAAEPKTPQPPADWPEFDWDAPEPEHSPGVSDRLPKPSSHFYGTAHQPEPEPTPPAWCYQPPDDHGDPPGSRLSYDVPRLVDFLTAKGLKPARPRVNLNVHLTDQTLLAGDGVVRVDDSGPMLLTQLVELLGRHHCQISLRPVLDPANLAAVDSYEIPQTLRDAV